MNIAYLNEWGGKRRWWRWWKRRRRRKNGLVLHEPDQSPLIETCREIKEKKREVELAREGVRKKRR